MEKREKLYCIYQITNTVNNKIYVGAHETYNIEDRYWGSGTLLIKAFKKYGVENFTREILFFLSSRKEMYAKEAEIVNAEFIVRTDTYNIELGGHGGGNSCSEETKKKMSLIMTGKKHTEEAKKKMSIAQSNKSPEHCAKISAAKMGIPRSPETVAKVSASLTGRVNGPHTEETKLKCSISKMGHEVSEETRRKLAEANLGKHWTEEAKAKRKVTSERKRIERAVVKAQEDALKALEPVKERVVSDETRKLLSIAGTCRTHTAEAKQKISDKNSGKIHTEESRRNMSEAHLGKQLGEDNPFYGKQHSPESIEKMRLAHKGKPCSEETKAKKREIARLKKLEKEALVSIAV